MLNPFETGQARVRGSIEVICGSMFSGKTEELLRRLRRAKIAGLRVEIFKPSVDKIHAICVGCGSWANYSYRLVSGEQQVMLGEAKEYSPLCRTCYLKHTQTNKES